MRANPTAMRSSPWRAGGGTRLILVVAAEPELQALVRAAALAIAVQPELLEHFETIVLA